MVPSKPIPASPTNVRGPVLLASIDGIEQTVPLGSTLTIGSDPRSALRVDEPAVRSLHARIVREPSGTFILRCEGDARVLAWPERHEVDQLVFEPGAFFEVGSVLVRCELAETPAVAPPTAMIDGEEALYGMATEAWSGSDDAADVARVSCPRCRVLLVHLPVEASFCPRCGLDLPKFCPAIFEDESGKPLTPEQLGITRPATLLAYINSLFNLGLRYELARGGDRNVGQAVRYYEKAAKLGSAPAKARLTVTLLDEVPSKPARPGEHAWEEWERG